MEIPIPRGAIKEVAEVLACIDKKYHSRENSSYIINLIGHGSICMGKTINDIKGIQYIGRILPEIIINNAK